MSKPEIKLQLPEGVTMRDYFASQALAGGLEQGVEHDLAEILSEGNTWWHPPHKIARRAYAIADAMIKARG